MIQAIIFDYNGVLTTKGYFEPLVEELATKQRKNVPEAQLFVRRCWDLARIDAITCSTFWHQLASFFEYDQQQLRREWLGLSQLRPEIISLLPKLKKKYKLALLTNNIRDWFEEDLQKYGFSPHFDLMVTSYEAKAAKPDQDIFLYLLERLPVSPAECLFVDDQVKNTSAAEKLGFRTIVFSSFLQLEQELRQRNVTY